MRVGVRVGVGVRDGVTARVVMASVGLDVIEGVTVRVEVDEGARSFSNALKVCAACVKASALAFRVAPMTVLVMLIDELVEAICVKMLLGGVKVGVTTRG